ncbi:copper resistance CopC/CopD family protein [Salipaludibacillus sp. CF4.18]|uniref:copper resistance CopC/CopD family protein n=1 Tax=Salipaludibacillus sp. CF4.18 TaxID=3373081 RepID=UPI003EE6A773
MRKTNYFKGLWMILALFFSVFFITVEVEAHSDIEEIKPDIRSMLEEIPDEIDITFAEPISLYSNSIQMKDSQGTSIEMKEPTVDGKNLFLPIPDDLTPGTYTVFINVIGMDGHELNEQFTFEISQSIEKKENDKNEPENHLRIEKTIPHDGELIKKNPEKIEIWFTDEIENDRNILFGLFDDQMRPIDIKEEYINPENPRSYIIELNEQLESGSYQANWYTQGGNGGDNGIFYFAINEVTSIVNSKVSIDKVDNNIEFNKIAKWLSYVGVFVLFGVMFFQLFISKGAEYLRRWSRMVHLFYVTALLGFILVLIFRFIELENVPFKELLTFQFMWVTFSQFILLVSAYWIKLLKYRFLVISSVILLWSVSGHSSLTGHGGLYAIFFDLLHLFTGAIWIGGLFALLIMMPKDNPVIWLKKYGKIYSEFAFLSIISLSVSGLGMIILYLPSFSLESLMVSNWGNFLLLKIILFTIILFIGLLQRYFLHSKKQLNSSFLLRTKTELMIGFIIIFVAASLMSSSPRTAEQGVYPRQLVADHDVSVTVDITPFKAGYGDMVLEFDAEQSIESVDIVLSMAPDYEREQRAFNLGDGRFQVTGGLLHAPGTMTLDILVETDNGEIVEIPYIIQVPGERMDD